MYTTSTGVRIHANREYTRDLEDDRERYRYNSNFSFVEIKVTKEGLETRHDLAQVLGIIELKPGTVLLVVIWMKDCEDDSQNVMHHRRLKYYQEDDRSGFRVECVSSECVTRGAYIYRSPD